MKIFMIYLFFIGFDIFVVLVVLVDVDDFIVDSSKTGIYDT